MKTIAFSMFFASLFILASCSNDKKIDTANCKAHERSCPISENCPEHPECEAHESCPKGADCGKHPSCVAYDKSRKES